MSLLWNLGVTFEPSFQPVQPKILQNVSSWSLMGWLINWYVNIGCILVPPTIKWYSGTGISSNLRVFSQRMPVFKDSEAKDDGYHSLLFCQLDERRVAKVLAVHSLALQWVPLVLVEPTVMWYWQPRHSKRRRKDRPTKGSTTKDGGSWSIFRETSCKMVARRGMELEEEVTPEDGLCQR